MGLKDSSNSKQFPDLNADSAPRGAYPAGASLPPTSTGVFLSTAEAGSDCNHAPGGSTVLHAGTSPHFFNKENRAPEVHYCKQHTKAAQSMEDAAAEAEGRPARKVAAILDQCWAFSKFQARELTTTQLVEQILGGGAWISSVFGGDGRRTNDNWLSAMLIPLDYDANVSVAECVEKPLIRQYAMLVHPSASSSATTYKTRVVFRLDVPYTDIKKYRLAIIAAGRLLGLPEDACSYKPAQLYYGSTNRIEQPHINLDAVLPVALLNEEIERIEEEERKAWAEAERQRTARNFQPVAKDSTRAERKMQQRRDRAYQKVVSAPSDRTKAAFGQAFYLARFITYWSITEAEITDDMLKALTANGAVKKYGKLECLRAIENGITAGLEAVPEPCELPEKKYIAKIADSHKGEDQPSPIVTMSNEAVSDSNHPSIPETPQVKPLTLREAAVFMVVGQGAEVYPLIELHALANGWSSFTVAQLAERMGKSVDAVEKSVKSALRWRAISELSVNFRIRSSSKELVRKNADNLPDIGGRPSKSYVLTPQQSSVWERKYVAAGVERIAERGTPDTIYSDELQAAFPDRTNDDALLLEEFTGTIASSEAASETRIRHEKQDYEKAGELLLMAERDETPFQPDELPCSVAELRRRLVEAYHATDPDRDNWKHSEFMWVLGMPQKSVGGPIRKSNISPAAYPTFKDVKLEGGNLYEAARTACKKQGAAGVAWVDARGEVICHLTPRVPKEAVAVRMNCGKRYFKTGAKPVMPVDPAEEQTAAETPLLETPQAEIETPEQAAERDQAKARRALKQRLNGCFEADGWRYVPGPYAYWQRREGREWVTCDNTPEAMIERLLIEAKQVVYLSHSQSSELIGEYA